MSFKDLGQNKAFLVAVPILISIFISLFTYVDGQISKVENLAYANQHELALRDHNVNTLVPHIDERQEIIYKNQLKMCFALGVECE